jgi:hypothetical protein
MEHINNIQKWLEENNPVVISDVDNYPESNGKFTPEFINRMLVSMKAAGGYDLRHLVISPQDMKDIREEATDDDPDPFKTRERISKLDKSIWSITFQVDDTLDDTGIVYGIDDSDPAVYHICVGHTNRK